VERTQGLLRERLGKTPLLYRSPWLWRQPMLLRMLVGHRLQPVSGTFCHPLEVFQPNRERIPPPALPRTKPGSILIFHDGCAGRGGDRSETVRAVRLATEELLRQGYRFVTVDEMLTPPAYSPQ